jgi:branched-subunit amino acid transport protein
VSAYTFAILVGAAAVTYLTRIAGLYAGNRDLSLRAQRILAYVPIGAFTAIVALGFTDSNGEINARLPAAVVAGALALMKKPLWLCLLAGLVVYFGFRTVVN